MTGGTLRSENRSPVVRPVAFTFVVPGGTGFGGGPLGVAGFVPSVSDDI